ncbi:MAG: hypothetical protein HC780_06695 [Leptolyngbyaceae cyanobacterium CSU_1_3]|nr:hypothetical protein [Leptolyngbyaceae cyanobacterium CSU_1_3]
MKSILSAVRFLVTACLCAVLLFSSVITPAFAAPNPNQPVKGEATEPAKTYERTAKDVIDKAGLRSLEEVTERAQNGAINEVQGTAGIEDMKRPSNSSGDTIEKKIKRGLEKAADTAKSAVQ